MLRFRLLALVLVMPSLACWPAAVAAQNSAVAIVGNDTAACPAANALALTLASAARRAACLEPENARSTAQLQQALAGVDERRAALASQWSAQLSPSINAERGLGGASNTDTSFHSTSMGATLRLDRTLWDGGSRRARIVQSERDASAAAIDQGDSLLQSEAAFVGLWIDVRQAQTRQESTRAALAAAEASAAAAAARAQLGDATMIDVLTAQSALAQAQRDSLSADLVLVKTLGLLSVRLGWPADQALVLAGDDGAALAPIPETPLLDQHPQARAQQERVLALRAALDAVRAESGSSVSLSAELGPNVSRSNFLGAGQRTSSQWAGSVGLRFSLPLADGGSRRAAEVRARSMLDAALATQSLIQRSLEETLWRARSEWRSALADEAASKASLRAAQVSEQAQRGRYAAGAGRLTDLLQAQSELAQRQNQADDARAQRLRSHAALRQAAGLSALALNEGMQ